MAEITNAARVASTIALTATASVEPQKVDGTGPKVASINGSSIGIACRKDNQNGVRIISVLPGSPAAEAGLAGNDSLGHRPATDHQFGDRIVGIVAISNGKERRHAISSPQGLQEILSEKSEGDTIKFEYICSRTGVRSITKPVALDPARGVIGIDFNRGFGSPTKVDVGQYGSLPAARAGLQTGDEITSITVKPKDGGAAITVQGDTAVSYLTPGGKRKNYNVLTIDRYAELIPQIKAGDSVNIQVLRANAQATEKYGIFWMKTRTVTPISALSIEIKAVPRPASMNMDRGNIFKL